MNDEEEEEEKTDKRVFVTVRNNGNSCMQHPVDIN